ncbi:transcriptional regulator [Pedobacter changchengzhani]|uniref:Transcriptional regulator n=1 Tax=Pedobacter changchengzhani TaxID=2529274 RepID=A0A4V3A0A6_9SPHI|nr:helix-turn-helix domain-containing protein [Pedobacter changchengzhani]TDG36703.1 transcriptional regulator [Pedobacter changchengzhani]
MKNKEKHVNVRDVQDVLDLIGGRWKSAILASLCDKEKRFNELKRDLGTITPKILIKELKFLEMNKLIHKADSLAVSSFQIYHLTAHGRSLEPLIVSIVMWGKKHREMLNYS